MKQKFMVKNPLPVCTDCLALNIKFPGGGTDFVKKRSARKAGKEALGKNDVVTSRTTSGRKKGCCSH